MSAVPTFRSVVLDCPDPKELAEFYAALLEWPAPEVQEEGEWVVLQGPEGMRISFQRVAGYRPPEWPSQTMPQQLHIDLAIVDVDAGRERAVSLGAKLLDESAETFWVYADPAGHPFCLCAC